MKWFKGSSMRVREWLHTEHVFFMDTLLLRFRRCYTFTDILCLFLPVCAAAFWLIPLSTIDIGRMNALGLVSVLPPLMLFSLLILTG
jgi:hypothetical protein